MFMHTFSQEHILRIATTEPRCQTCPLVIDDLYKG